MEAHCFPTPHDFFAEDRIAFEEQERSEREEYFRETDNGKRARRILEARLIPLQDSISQNIGQLIAMHSQDYRVSHSSMNSPFFERGRLEATSSLEIGVITPETKIAFEKIFQKKDRISLSKQYVFLEGIKDTYIVNSGYGEPLEQRKDTTIFEGTPSMIPGMVLYFMDKPALEKKLETYREGHIIEISRPSRLRFFVGDEKVTDYLQKVLLHNAWSYDLIGEVFDKEFPHGEEILERIRTEQIEIYDKIILAEEEYLDYDKEFRRRLKNAEHSDLIDPTFVRLNMGGELGERKRALDILIAAAQKREYDRWGIQTKRDIRPGVTENFNFKEFFSSIISKYSE